MAGAGREFGSVYLALYLLGAGEESVQIEVFLPGLGKGSFDVALALGLEKEGGELFGGGCHKDLELEGDGFSYFDLFGVDAGVIVLVVLDVLPDIELKLPYFPSPFVHDYFPLVPVIGEGLFAELELSLAEIKIVIVEFLLSGGDDGDLVLPELVWIGREQPRKTEKEYSGS